ncbi:MAG: DUF167 domain-containing protein [Rickettsiales bacterium]|jgi:uncharacterized protein (TIGR00251 family)|nr:DUF167 domain-containing protein [Rickettsiales bacterium]
MKTIIINIKAFDGERFNEIGGIINDSDGIKHLRIKITKPAKSGAANLDIISILSKNCKVPKANIMLVKGEKARYKQFSIEFEEEAQISGFLKSVISI